MICWKDETSFIQEIYELDEQLVAEECNSGVEDNEGSCWGWPLKHVSFLVGSVGGWRKHPKAKHTT